MFKKYNNGYYSVSGWKVIGPHISPNDFIVVGMPQQIRNEIQKFERDFEHFGSNKYHIYSLYLDKLMGTDVDLFPQCEGGKLVSFRVSMKVLFDDDDDVEEYEFGFFDLSNPIDLSDLPERYFESYPFHDTR